MTNDFIDLYPSEDFTKIEYLGENFSIKNRTSATIEFTYNELNDKSHLLDTRDSIENIGQDIFIRVRYAPNDFARLEITRGVAEKIAIANLSSGIGSENAIKLDAWGLQKLSQDYRIWRDTFYSGVSRKVWNIDTLNGYDKAVQGSGLFSSGDQPSDYYTGYSRKHSRYQPNSGILISIAGAFPNPTATGGIRRWGAATIEDGYYFEIAEDGICYTVVRQSDFENYIATTGQDTFAFPYNIASSSTVYVRVKYDGEVVWQDITSDIATVDTALNQVVMTTPLASNDEICIVSVNNLRNEITTNLEAEGIDLSKQVLFDIQAGAADVIFTVRSATPSGTPVGVQVTYNNLGQNERANISNTALSAYVECKNISSSGTEYQMKLGCINISAEGGQKDEAELESVSNDIKVPITCGSTTDDIFSMIVFNPKYCKGRINTRDVEAIKFSTRADHIFFATVYTTNNLLFLTGGAVFKERDADSCILYDNNLNADNTVARNDEVDISTMKDNITEGEDANKTVKITKTSDDADFLITPGECMVVIPRKELTSGTTKANTTILFGERT